jgi:hypothetical protein
MQRTGGPARRHKRAGERISVALRFAEDNCLGDGISRRNITKYLKENEVIGGLVLQ